MSKTLTISDELADLLEAQRRRSGYDSLDDTAEALIAHGLIADDLDQDHSFGFSDEELRTLIDEAETGGPETPWNAKDVRTEVVRRYLARPRGNV